MDQSGWVLFFANGKNASVIVGGVLGSIVGGMWGAPMAILGAVVGGATGYGIGVVSGKKDKTKIDTPSYQPSANRREAAVEIPEKSQGITNHAQRLYEQKKHEALSSGQDFPRS